MNTGDIFDDNTIELKRKKIRIFLQLYTNDMMIGNFGMYELDKNPGRKIQQLIFQFLIKQIF